jgi:acylglycerol lipase
MKHIEGFFKNQQEQSIFYQYWLPETSPKAALLVIHGLNEHSGRYSNFAEFFTSKGYAVFSMDHIGHGKSEGTRSFAKKFSYYIDDILVYVNMISDWVPNIPIYPVGHSLGGLINTYLLLDHQHLFAGAVFSGSVVLVPEYVSSFTITMGKIISRILPKMGLLEIDKQSISRDPDVVQAYLNDPLVFNGKITVRVSSEMNQAIERISQDGENISLPVLILHGSEDKIVEPECSRYLHDKVSSLEKELIIYDGFYHEIYNEPEKLTVFNDVLRWLDRQISKN